MEHKHEHELDMTVYHDWEKTRENGEKIIRQDSFGDLFATRILYRICEVCRESVEFDRVPDYRALD
jgi:hypothetical protein